MAQWCPDKSSRVPLFPLSTTVSITALCSNTCSSQWHKFTPYTNVLWINYLTTKTKIKGKLKGIRSKVWEVKFKPYLRNILKYTSVRDVFLNVFNPDKPVSYTPQAHSNSKQPV